MKKFLNAVMAWMLAHPVIEHLLEGAIYAVIMSVIGCLKLGISDPAHVLTIGSMGAAALLGLKGWYGINKTLILAQAQDQLQALALLGQQAPPTPASLAGVTVNSVPPPTSAALTPIPIPAVKQ